jgi:hypothetical protein
MAKQLSDRRAYGAGAVEATSNPGDWPVRS